MKDPSKFAATIGAGETASSVDSAAAGSKEGELGVEAIESSPLEGEVVEADPSLTSPQLLASNAFMFTMVTLHESLRQEASYPSCNSPLSAFISIRFTYMCGIRSLKKLEKIACIVFGKNRLSV